MLFRYRDKALKDAIDDQDAAPEPRGHTRTTCLKALLHN